MNRGVKLANAVRLLAGVTLQLNDLPWLGVLWDEGTKVMITKHGVLAQNLFLHLVGYEPEPQDYDLGGKYRAVTGKSLPRRAHKITP
jgi:hypothetical protein